MSKKNNYKVYVHIAPNGKRYYGITKQKVERRWANGKGYPSNEHFTNAINKHGWDNFEHIVIARGLTEEEAKWLEIELIREWKTSKQDYGYNQSLGGESGNHSEESRKKISENHANMKGEKNPMYGKRGELSPLYGRYKGEKNPMYGKKGKDNPNSKQIYCIELDMYFDSVTKASEYIGCSRKNISHVLRGEQQTASGYHFIYAEEVNEENINKVMSQEYKDNPNKKQIYCVELDRYFDSITEASKIIGCHRQGISKVLNGKYKTCGGYHWLYAEDVEKIEIENNKVS